MRATASAHSVSGASSRPFIGGMTSANAAAGMRVHTHTHTYAHTPAHTPAHTYPRMGAEAPDEDTSPMHAGSRSRLVAAASPRHEGILGSTLGALALRAGASTRACASVLHVEEEEEEVGDGEGLGADGYVGGVEGDMYVSMHGGGLEEAAAAAHDEDASMRTESEVDGNASTPPCRDPCATRGHVRINSRPLVITYTPKTAMTESEAASICSSPGSTMDMGSDAGGTSPGMLFTGDTSTGSPVADFPLVAGLRISAVRANADAAALGLSGEDPTPGILASLRIGVRQHLEDDAATTMGVPASLFGATHGGRPLGLSLSLKSPAVSVAAPLTEAELAYQQSTTLSPHRCGIAARARAQRAAMALSTSSSEDSGDERTLRARGRRGVEGVAGLSGGGHATVGTSASVSVRIMRGTTEVLSYGAATHTGLALQAHPVAASVGSPCAHATAAFAHAARMPWNGTDASSPFPSPADAGKRERHLIALAAATGDTYADSTYDSGTAGRRPPKSPRECTPMAAPKLGGASPWASHSFPEPPLLPISRTPTGGSMGMEEPAAMY